MAIVSLSMVFVNSFDCNCQSVNGICVIVDSYKINPNLFICVTLAFIFVSDCVFLSVNGVSVSVYEVNFLFNRF